MRKITLSLFFTTFYSLLSFSQTIVSTTPQNRKVILEEFTGINCVYCPQGHTIANNIKNANPNNVFLVNVHVGGFSTPGAGQPDFRTPFGSGFTGQAGVTGYPAGTVNRTQFSGLAQNGGTGTAMNRNNWTNATNQILAQSSYVNVATTASINVSTRVLTVLVEAYYTGSSPVATNRLNVALLQNNTLGPQTGGNLGDQYNHQHRLVHMITGQWGETINTTTSGTFVTRTYNYTIPASYNLVPAEMGEFEVVAFMAESQQKIVSGNGAAATYTGLISNDASIKEVKGISDQCVASVSPKIEIQNYGQNNLTTLPITYSINGGTPQIFNWSGNLAPLARQVVNLSSISYNLQASNTLNVSIPTDGNNANNSGVTSFAKASETATSDIVIKITLDQYGSETSWELRNSAGTVVASSPTYADAAAAGEYPQPDVNLTVPNDCYTFIVNDSYGDGMYGAYGFGGYQVFSNGNVIPGIEGGNFGGSESKTFGVNNPLSSSEFESSAIELYPNPTTGVVYFKSNYNADVEILDLTGKVLITVKNISNNETINLNGLQAGVYLAKFMSEGREEIKKIILN
ncbi:Omp28-related outer membrane protein [Flavobacterium sp.]|uniref:T9SS type A sorting domain-containing protein n=1 Tax=Flavobacterium sp. TaxID=239 RepID=UPI002619451A|nr:Omp28-related outer membrane protein [Flavobacterium sp.]